MKKLYDFLAEKLNVSEKIIREQNLSIPEYLTQIQKIGKMRELEGELVDSTDVKFY